MCIRDRDYDVEFVLDGTHYTYAIDALTVAVIESESEAALYGDGQTGDTATQTDGAVDEAKAKQIALDHAGGKEADTAYPVSYTHLDVYKRQTAV